LLGAATSRAYLSKNARYAKMAKTTLEQYIRDKLTQRSIHILRYVEEENWKKVAEEARLSKELLPAPPKNPYKIPDLTAVYEHLSIVQHYAQIQIRNDGDKMTEPSWMDFAAQVSIYTEKESE
jgi:hypothetical protein